MLFKSTLNQFLGCTRLDIKKALSVSEKFRNLAKNKLEKVLQIIKQLSATHKEVVKGICSKIIRGFSVGLFSTSLPVMRQIFEQR
jgi:hypothetical protein